MSRSEGEAIVHSGHDAGRSPKRIVDVRDVTVRFDGFKALDGLSFSLSQGELRFLIGPNGAGKTTLLDILTGKTRPSSGEVIFDGHLDVRRLPEHKLVQHGIARKFQTPTVFGSLSVYGNLEAAVGFKDGAARLFGALSEPHRRAIASTLATIGLAARAETRAGLLSHGEKQWLEIGMLLMQDPQLLMLDEPVAGMSPAEREQTADLLNRI